MDFNELILLAYNDLQESIKAEQGKSDFDKKALTNLLGLYREIEKWEPDKPVDFIWDYVDGEGANCVSGQGMAKTALPNFKVFLDDSITKEKIKQLFLIRKENSTSPSVLNKIDEVGLHDYLERFKFEKGSKPRLYVNRLLLILFIDIMTTIANPSDLKKVAEKLEIKASNFARLQYQIRDRVNDALETLNIEPKSKFERAAIAWHILRVDN